MTGLKTLNNPRPPIQNRLGVQGRTAPLAVKTPTRVFTDSQGNLKTIHTLKKTAGAPGTSRTAAKASSASLTSSNGTPAEFKIRGEAGPAVVFVSNLDPDVTIDDLKVGWLLKNFF